MKCYLHEDRDAVGVCVSCNKPVCDECGVEFQGRLMCRDCLASGEAGQLQSAEITDNDKMMALLAYIVTIIVPLVILLSESGKQRLFQRYHAIHSLILSGGLIIITVALSCTVGVVLELLTAGLGTCCLLPAILLPYVISIIYGVQAYQGNYVEIPLVTDLARSQGWI
jgi:uncharacterized membrane protein